MMTSLFFQAFRHKLWDWGLLTSHFQMWQASGLGQPPLIPQNHEIIESLRLEKTSETIKSH